MLNDKLDFKGVKTGTPESGWIVAIVQLSTTEPVTFHAVRLNIAAATKAAVEILRGEPALLFEALANEDGTPLLLATERDAINIRNQAARLEHAASLH